MRIAIIGAGPAGLSMAFFLEKAGYTDYVIYEKEDHVGGKCHSPFYNGKRYEQGAIMGVPSYYALKEIIDYCDIKPDGPELKWVYRDKNGSYDDPYNIRQHPENIEEFAELRKEMLKLKELLSTKYRYYDINGHRGVSKGEYHGYTNDGLRTKVDGYNPNLKDLALPYDRFLELNNIERTSYIWKPPFTSFGYGYFNEIPAAYVLKYLDYQTLTSFNKRDLWTFKEGTQSIFETLNKKLLHPALLNQNISYIARNNKVIVTSNGKEETFDKVIFTCPLSHLPYLDKEEEIECFRKIRFMNYAVLSFTGKTEESYYVLDNMTSDRLGHVMCMYDRFKEDNQAKVAYILLNNDEYGLPDREYTNPSTAIGDLKTFNSDISETLDYKVWYYFPHIIPKDYQDGWYEKVESIQGKYQSYYAGEIMSFGNMDEVCEYSRQLVMRFF